MITAILNKLTSDAALSTLLGAVEATETKEADTRLYPLSSDNFGPCICYSARPQNGGLVKQSTLELRIITEDYDLGLDIEKRVNELLDLEEDNGTGWIDSTAGVNILSSNLSGGGELQMGTIYQRYPSYTIKWRYMNDNG